MMMDDDDDDDGGDTNTAGTIFSEDHQLNTKRSTTILSRQNQHTHRAVVLFA